MAHKNTHTYARNQSRVKVKHKTKDKRRPPPALRQVKTGI